MVVAIANQNGQVNIPLSSWNQLLSLASRHGWRPRGTVRPGRWSGSYTQVCGQMITEDDARCLRAALLAALPDVPDHDAQPEAAERAPNLYEAFSGPRKPQLRELLRRFFDSACFVAPLCADHGAPDTLLS